MTDITENEFAMRAIVQDTIAQLADLVTMVATSESEDNDTEGVKDFFIGGSFIQLTEAGRKYQVQISLVSDPEWHTEPGSAHVMEGGLPPKESLIIQP